MAVVTGALGSLIPKLAQFLHEEYKLQKGTRKKIKSLIEELECARTALHKVAAVPPDQLDEHIKIWGRQVREASYDMEDIIDTFLVRVDGGQKSSFLKLLPDFICELLERRQVAVAMNDINKRLEEVTQRYDRYNTVCNNIIPLARPEVLDPRLAAMYQEVTELVGLKKPSSDLIAMLSPQGHENLKIVSVVGVGGLGKTTLAKSVYHKLKKGFDCWAFVPVGRNPDLRKVFRDILIEIDRKKYVDEKWKMLDGRQLIDELREILGNNRYLLVIDDIWETQSWETIRLALVQENNGSRVITTTRILEVAKNASEICKLQPLPYDKSKKLLYMRIFGDEGKCPDDNELDEICDKILKKCGGVPLAIITMASMLADKSRTEWYKVCKSIAFHDKDNKQVTDTEWILSLSYYDLPPHLKTCLLYLSLFPEDHFINKDSLIWMWIGEGFIDKNEQETSLFETGNRYFNDLINRGMIQAVKFGLTGMVCCLVHDMVLDLLRLKSQEENFVTIMSNNVDVTLRSSRVRRINNQNWNKMAEDTQMHLGHVRSFIALGSHLEKGSLWNQIIPIDKKFSFRSFNLLRVLALEHCMGVGSHTSMCISLEHLGKLLHLRYLGLRGSFIEKIPEQIGGLKFLQTIDMDDEVARIQDKRLPTSVGQLTQLICLNTRFMEVPKGIIEKLTSLEELKICVHRSEVLGDFVKDLGKLRELRVINVHFKCPLDDTMERDIMESLGHLHKIQHLELHREWGGWTGHDGAEIRKTVILRPSLRCLIVPWIRFFELPSCISPSGLPNLTHLDLWIHHMEDRHLKLLGQLPELRKLGLKLGVYVSDNPGEGPVISTVSCTITDACFQKLRSLWLPSSMVQFVHTEDWSAPFAGDKRSTDFGTKKRDKCMLMPKLEVLTFTARFKNEVNDVICDNLGLDCLPSLKTVHICLEDHSSADAVKREEAALTEAMQGHPNRPTLQMLSYQQKTQLTHVYINH